MARNTLRITVWTLAISCTAIAACAAEDPSSTARTSDLAGSELLLPGVSAGVPGNGQASAGSSTGVGAPGGTGANGGSGANGAGPGAPGAPGAFPTTCPDGQWCSALYPPTWSPSMPADAEGRFLHDFSFAGYRYGEAPPSNPPGAVYDVVASFGANASGAADATAAIQAAVDAASRAGGGIVFLPAGTYRLDGVLSVRASGVVLRGAGTSTVLRFTKPRGMGFAAGIALSGSLSRDTPRALVADVGPRATELTVKDATGLAPGDDVAVGWTITPAFVEEHGMSGTWTSFSGQYRQFFRSKVVSVDTSRVPARVVIDVPLRYAAKVRDGAALQKETGYLREVGIEHLALSTAVRWEDAWAENQSYAISLERVADAWVNDVHSVASPTATGAGTADKTAYHLRSSGILVADSKRVSVLHTTMEYPQNRGSGGNGYLFEVSRTSEVLLADCEARRGRHNFIQNWGFGNSGTVMLRCTSTGSEMLSLIGGRLTPEIAYSEHHHSLAMATLVDDCRLDDGFNFENRGAYSSGAGHTGTGSVVWRARGDGTVISKQYGWGYVIGTHAGIDVETDVGAPGGAGTAPEDVVEGRDQGATLYPRSLYEDQRARRLAR